MKPKLRAINKLYALLDEYAQDVEESPLTDNSKTDYVSFARMFVRWADNQFMPGEYVK